MSLTKTNSTTHWSTIPKKCKNCSRSIYTIENKKVYYQCSIFGTFKRNCEISTKERKLLKPKEIMENK